MGLLTRPTAFIARNARRWYATNKRAASKRTTNCHFIKSHAERPRQFGRAQSSRWRSATTPTRGDWMEAVGPATRLLDEP
jgi:hypothetical protein